MSNDLTNPTPSQPANWVAREETPAVALNATIEHYLVKAIRAMFRGEVVHVGTSPIGDPYARLEEALPMRTEEYHNGGKPFKKLHDTANLAMAKVNEILKTQCPGLIIEYAIMAGEKPEEPVKAHLLLYGDKNQRDISTIDGMNTQLVAKKHQINAMLDQVFSEKGTRALGSGGKA